MACVMLSPKVICKVLKISDLYISMENIMNYELILPMSNGLLLFIISKMFILIFTRY